MPLGEAPTWRSAFRTTGAGKSDMLAIHAVPIGCKTRSSGGAEPNARSSGCVDLQFKSIKHKSHNPKHHTPGLREVFIYVGHAQPSAGSKKRKAESGRLRWLAKSAKAEDTGASAVTDAPGEEAPPQEDAPPEERAPPEEDAPPDMDGEPLEEGELPAEEEEETPASSGAPAASLLPLPMWVNREVDARASSTAAPAEPEARGEATTEQSKDALGARKYYRAVPFANAIRGRGRGASSTGRAVSQGKGGTKGTQRQTGNASHARAKFGRGK